MSEDKEDDDLMKLRDEALKSMSKKSAANVAEGADNNTERVTNCSDPRTKSSQKSSHMKNNYYNFRNGNNRANRSNLIVLTQNESTPATKPDHKQTYTKLTVGWDTSASGSPDTAAKLKKVLPGRFNRRDSDDSDEDSDDEPDTDEPFSDDNPSFTVSAFDETSNDQTTDVSDIVIAEQSVEPSIEPKPDSNDKPIHNSEGISSNGSIGDTNSVNSSNTPTTVECDVESHSGKRDTINLTANDISESEALQRRNKKFGGASTQTRLPQTIWSADNGHKQNVKSGLDFHHMKSTNERISSSKREDRHERDRREDRTRGDKTERKVKTSRSGRTDRQRRSSDDSEPSKSKRLRSFVVIK